LFELLCTARTRAGQDTLASWLKSPARPDTVRARQQAVEELRPRVDLREELAVPAGEAGTGGDPAHLAAWGEAPVGLRERSFRIQLQLFTAIGLAGFLALWVHLANSAHAITLSDNLAALARDAFLLALIVNAWSLYRWRDVIGRVVGGVEE